MLARLIQKNRLKIDDLTPEKLALLVGPNKAIGPFVEQKLMDSDSDTTVSHLSSTESEQAKVC